MAKGKGTKEAVVDASTTSAPKKEKDARKQELSGKGLRRVVIAFAAMEKAEADFQAKRRRWEEAVETEKADRGKNKGKEAAKLRKVAATLREAGLVDEADAALRKAHDIEEG